MANANNMTGVTRLDVWTNGEKLDIPAPFRPYIYSKEFLGELPKTKAFSDVKKSLSTLKEEEYWCYELDHAGLAYRIKDEFTSYYGPGNFAEGSISYVHRILVDEPDFFRKFANTHELRVLHIDIEQYHETHFPTAAEPIISIGVGLNDGERFVFLATSLEDEPRILKEFAAFVRDYDPDIIVGYNVEGYDIPMIIRRCYANRINPMFFSRDETFRWEDNDEEPYLKIGGRIIYDLFHSVKKDQTLHGIKNRKLKTVAKWFKLKDVIEFPQEPFKNLIGTERLKEYNLSDIRITQQLFKIYFIKLQAMAEYLGCPLSEVIPFNDGFPATIIEARILRSKGIVSDGNNKVRHPNVFNGTKVEAANVDIYQKGYFNPVYKYDFASLYPHIMWSAGIGPDNTKLVGITPLGKFSVREQGTTRYYSIPDNNHKCNFEIEVEGESELAKFIQELLKQRLELKKEAERIGETEGKTAKFESLESQQYALKVVLNSFYGVQLDENNSYSDAAVGIMIVGFGREHINNLSETCKRSRIEIDTDGIYTSTRYDVPWLNNQINFLTEFVLLGKPVMKVEEEEFIAGWFNEMKNYILLHKKKGLVKHGAAYKGSNLPGVFDRIIDDLGIKVLTEGHSANLKLARSYTDLSRYDPEMFIQSVKMGKQLYEYAGDQAVAVQVAKDCERKTGLKPAKDNHYTYIKTSKGYEHYDEDAFSRIDVEYYQGIIFTALERLGFDRNKLKNRSLMEFG